MSKHIINVAATVPSSKAVSDIAKKDGVKASVAALKGVTSKIDAKLGVFATKNHEKKTGLGQQQTKIDAPAQTRKP